MGTNRNTEPHHPSLARYEVIFISMNQALLHNSLLQRRERDDRYRGFTAGHRLQNSNVSGKQHRPKSFHRTFDS